MNKLSPTNYLSFTDTSKARAIEWIARIVGISSIALSISLIRHGENLRWLRFLASAFGASNIAIARIASDSGNTKRMFLEVVENVQLENIATLTRISGSDELPLLVDDSQLEIFDWREFRDNSNSFPHLLVIAPTGGGKTSLAEYLLSLLPGICEVVTTKAKSSQWRNLKITGIPRNFEEIEERLERIVELMTERCSDLDSLQFPSEQLNIAIDELPAIAANTDSAIPSILTLAREAREAMIRVVILSQGKNVKTLGIEGQSDLLDCFTTIRLGKFALEHCEKLIRNRELPGNSIEWLKRQKRPGMVGDVIASVPDLSNFAYSANTSANTSSEIPGTTLTPPPALANTSNTTCYADPFCPPSEETVLAVLEAEAKGESQCQTIQRLWNVSKGTNRRYLAAREHYKSIVDGL
jgi:hypothetical protein